jgi:predicted transcriptional regulator of viral defense system
MDINLACTNAVAAQLSDWPQPVITDYELGRIYLSISDTPLTRTHYDKLIETLEAVKLVTPNKDFRGTAVYKLFGKTDVLPAAVACSADPFAYLSHLSAMALHGITDRLPKTLYLCTPPTKEWNDEARVRMERELGESLHEYKAAKLPLLRYVLNVKVGSSNLFVVRRSKRGAFKIIKDRGIRVATIARTFLDMIREPENCGGMQHVVDTYKAYAPTYLTQICSEVDQHGTAIDKVRTGYLLKTVCDLDHPAMERWLAFAQRGGSRKLDPNEEYASYYSDEWQLSINVPSLMPNNSVDE